MTNSRVFSRGVRFGSADEEFQSVLKSEGVFVCLYFPHPSKAKQVTVMTKDLPKTMRAVQGSDYGDIDEVISVVDGVLVPCLADLPQKKRKNFMVLKTLAVALAPGDCRVLSGKTRELQGPPSFPYVPAGDCCGIVVELPEHSSGNDLPFAVGDRVAARFVEGPIGALGEYALVSTLVADKVPEGISSEEAAALVGSSPATVLAERIQEGERVLVMGAGGGMGSTFCQMLRLRGASYIVGVSRSPDLLLKPPISCDEAIDYATTDPFSLEKFKNDKFDVIVDLAGGGFARLEECVKQNESLIVKSGSVGGRFITTVPPAGPHFEIHSWGGALQIFLVSCLWKAIISRTLYRSKLPKYTFGMSLSSDREPATRSLALARAGKLKAVIDTKGPFSFTTEGVRAAFRLQESRHPHGKVIVRVAEAS